MTPVLRQLDATEVSVRPLAAGERRDELPRCELLLDGHATGCQLDGAVLEAAVSCGDGRLLLFLTDGMPHEDFLTVVLLSAALDPQDGIALGAPYSTGSFSALRLVEPDTVGFRFIGDTDWAIQLLPAPRFGVPLFGDPTGVRRKFGLRRWFKVLGDPRPQAAAR